MLELKFQSTPFGLMGFRFGEPMAHQQAALDDARHGGFTGEINWPTGAAAQFLLQKSRSADTNGLDVGLMLGSNDLGQLTRLGLILDATDANQRETSQDVAVCANRLRDVLIEQFGAASAYMNDITPWSRKTPLQRHTDVAYLAMWQPRTSNDGVRVYPDVAMFTDDLAAYGRENTVVAYIRSQQNGVVAVVELYRASHSGARTGESTQEWIQRVFKAQPA